MENTASWNEVTKAIAEAMDEHQRMLLTQSCGPSAAMTVFNKLVEKGFLKEEHCKPKGGKQE